MPRLSYSMIASARGLIPLPEASAALLLYANFNDRAEIARCSYQSIWRRVRNGSIPAVQLGRGLFLEAERLQDIARTSLSLTGAGMACSAASDAVRQRHGAPPNAEVAEA
jgi:hypothetical protein